MKGRPASGVFRRERACRPPPRCRKHPGRRRQSGIAFLHATATGRASGAATSQPVTNVYDLVDGRIRRVRGFQDRAAAIEAAKLAE